MTRNTFAGASWDLLTEDCREAVWDASPEEFGDDVPRGRHAGVPQPDRPARVAAGRARQEADVRRSRQARARPTASSGACPISACPRTRSTSWSPISSSGSDRTHGADRTSNPSTRRWRRRRHPRRRPTACSAARSRRTGWKSWVFTIDHKKLGIMYGATAMFFFLVGGLEALLIRAQLAGQNGTILSADKYNQMFTMHATTMIFLFVMPMVAGFANYLVPLQIGARDVAFPRINAFGFWTLPRSAASSSTRRGCSAARPTAAGSCTPPTRRCRSRRRTASTSGRSACRSPASPR